MRNFILNILILAAICQVSRVSSQEYYWVELTDKNNTHYSLTNPVEYLSERAISRRIKQNIPIDSFDLPVNREYIEQVLLSGISLVHSSKWLNGITVKAEIDSFQFKIAHFPFVKEIQRTKPAMITKSASDKFAVLSGEIEKIPIDTSVYGISLYQIGQINGQFLHNQGFRGQGMQIAILDGGFLSVDSFFAFDSLWSNNLILGTKDFVSPATPFFTTDEHGMNVLSCMGGNVPGYLIGSAPKASFWLIRSEDTGSEYIIEEDNWVAAAEFADSVGVDIINSSVGYCTFMDPATNHTYADMDGKTTRVTRGANTAASRGILVFSSAGNEGNKNWKYIIAPSDGDFVIGVGAVKRDSVATDFTSFGPASDGDVKPNVSALGKQTFMQKSSGLLGYRDGTSFSSPLLAGMAACLWQAHPHATAAQVKSAMEQSGHLFDKPDSLLGFGIPDMYQANILLMNLKTQSIGFRKKWMVYPNPVTDNLVLQNTGTVEPEKVTLSFFSLDGRLLHLERQTGASKIVLSNLHCLPSGLFILKIDMGNSSESFKISKAF